MTKNKFLKWVDNLLKFVAWKVLIFFTKTLGQAPTIFFLFRIKWNLIFEMHFCETFVPTLIKNPFETHSIHRAI